MIAAPFCHVQLRGQIPKIAGYPRELVTIGNHIKRCRLDRGQLQKDVAQALDVCLGSIGNWEHDVGYPEVRFWPALTDWLGYDPNPEPENVAELLLALRRRLGFSQLSLATVIDVAPETISGWEQPAHRPTGRARRQLSGWIESLEVGDDLAKCVARVVVLLRGRGAVVE